MYMIHTRTRSLMTEIFSYNNQSNGSNETIDSYKQKLYVRYGSFYFRMGVVGFGVGSLIYSTFKFGQYFEFNSSDGSCVGVLRAIKPATRIAFILLQMLFIFSFSNFIAVQKSQLIAKFGLMHLIATNVSDWFQVVVEQTVHDLNNTVMTYSRHHNSTMKDLRIDEYDSRLLNIMRLKHVQEKSCQKLNLITPILMKIEPHLASCAVEYNLLCTMILLLMWKISTSQKKKEASRDLSTEISRQSGSNAIYGRSQSQFSVDCAQTQRGLFSGILVLAVTIISLIVFFEFVPYDDKKDVALLQMMIWESIIFFISIVAVLMSAMTLRDLKISNTNIELPLEHLLLLVTQSGMFIYCLFQIISGCLMRSRVGMAKVFGILTPTLGVLQSCCQTTFILDARRRCCSTEDQIKRKPGRQLITFLLLLNVSLWVINRIKNNRSIFHPRQMDFYGILAWNIITHVSNPLIVSYRFQATVCFYEIWKHVYKRPIKRSLNEDMRLENHS
ncbi:proton channel OtopLc-like isoform X2 [Diabrotica virgifera virgifera]|nr:proton channel OtopLc-like isoform X2 [Diabrotica virgifera virgifera]